ncbi:hypothetical protein KR222_005071 [Zaprionus bogoriensis]|nr:hypothetical protein KR222_005071 [Zaprionus bogoriensis]
MNKVVENKFIPQQLLHFIAGQRCCQYFKYTFRRADHFALIDHARSLGLRFVCIAAGQGYLKVFKQSCKHYLEEPRILKLCHSTIIEMKSLLSNPIFIAKNELKMLSEQIDAHHNMPSLDISMDALCLPPLRSKLRKHCNLSADILFPGRREVVKSIYAHRITVFQANLSLDKSLLLPKIILEEFASRNGNLKVICIENEIVTATYNSERLAYALGENVGGTVGLQVPQQSFISSETLVVYTTAMYFLRSIFNKNVANFNHISHVVVSDVHSHAPYTDILLYELKKSLNINHNIRIILLSEHYDPNHFVTFFGEGTEICVEGICQFIPKISYLEDIRRYLELYNIHKDPEIYKNRPQRLKSKINKQIDDCLKVYEEIGSDAAFRPFLYAINCENIPVNYQHSLTGKTAIFLASQLGNINHLKLLLHMGADPYITDKQNENAITIASVKNYSECLKILNNYTLNCYAFSKANPGIVDFDVLIDIVYLVCTNTDFEKGNILIILPTYNHMAKLNYMLLSWYLTGKLGELSIFLVYENMDQKYLHALSSSLDDKVKVVLATCIIESLPVAVSFTYLIDTVCEKNTFYDASSCSSEDKFEWVSKDCLLRRQSILNAEGRNVEYFRLVSKEIYENLRTKRKPALQTMQLDKICLSIKFLSPGTVISEYLMNTISPPSSINVHQTVQFLKKIDILDEFENVTWLGCRLIDIPTSCQLGRVLVFGLLLQCLDPILTIVSALLTADPLHISFNEDTGLWSGYTVYVQNCIKRERSRLANGQFSDHLIFVRLFEEWHNRMQKNLLHLFLIDEYDFMQNALMEQLSITRCRIIGALRAANLIHSEGPLRMQTVNLKSKSWPLVKAALTGGMYPNICVVDTKVNCFKSAYSKSMYLHSNTVLRDFLAPFNISAQNIRTQWIVCNRQKSNIKHATVVVPLAVALFCGNTKLKLRQNKEIKAISDVLNVDFFIDEWLWISSQKSTFSMLMRVRQIFFKSYHYFLKYCSKLEKLRIDSTYMKQYHLLIEALAVIFEDEDTAANFRTDPLIGFRPAFIPLRLYLHNINLHFTWLQSLQDKTLKTKIENNYINKSKMAEKYYFLIYTNKSASEFYTKCDELDIKNIIGKFTRPIESPRRHIYIILYSKNPEKMLSISQALRQNGELIFKEYFRNEIPVYEILDACTSLKLNVPSFNGRLMISLIDKRVGNLIMDLFAFRHHWIH